MTGGGSHGVARHHETDLLFVFLLRVHLSHESSFIDDGQPIGQSIQLLQLERYQKHRLAGVARLDQLLVHELYRANVQSACRLNGDDELGIAFQLPGDNRLLLIAAG